MKYNPRNVTFAMTAVFAIAAFVFWCVGGASLLSDREQTMLFLFNSEYLSGRMAVPGGLARYIGEFLTQFFFDARAGALAVTVLLLLVQRLTLSMVRRLRPECSFRLLLLSFLPSVVAWVLLMIPSVSMTLIAAVVMVLLAMALMPQGLSAQVVYLALMLPLCYWLAGPAVWLLVGYAFIGWLCRLQSRLTAVGLGVVASLVLVCCIFVSSRFVSYPASQLMRGVDYYWTTPYASTFKQTMEVSDQMLLRGYVNGSQRNAFEAMELIPNYNKSARVLVRLTDVALATNQPELALKYISILEETLFYRGWARRVRPLAEHPELLEQHPYYGKMLHFYQNTNDAFFL